MLRKLTEGDDIKTDIITAVSLDEAEFDRLLIENDDDDGDDDGVIVTKESVEKELEEMDINLISESDIDRSIQNAVQKLVDSGPKEPELSRVETFENIYKVSFDDSDPDLSSSGVDEANWNMDLRS